MAFLLLAYSGRPARSEEHHRPVSLVYFNPSGTAAFIWYLLLSLIYRKRLPDHGRDKVYFEPRSARRKSNSLQASLVYSRMFSRYLS